MTRLPITATLLAVALALPAASQEASSPAPTDITPEAREALRAEIRSYLLDNPEVIIEAIQVLEERRKAETAANDESLVERHREALENDGFSWVGGNPEGDVTLVEFFDYRCGFCKRAHPVVDRLVKEDGNIRLVLKEFPILGPESVMAGRMAMAALEIDPSKYRALNDALMAHRGRMTEVAAYRIAKEVGYDLAALKAREDSPEITARLDKTHALAEDLGVQGTPAFVIGDRIVRGFVEYEDMAGLVAEVRAQRAQ